MITLGYVLAIIGFCFGVIAIVLTYRRRKLIPNWCVNHPAIPGTVLMMDDDDEYTWFCYACYERELRRRQVSTSVLVVSTMREADLYRKAYSGLLDNIEAISYQELHKIEGRRITRAYITEEVDMDCEVLDYVHKSLSTTPDADDFPIYLWVDHKNYLDFLKG